MASRGNACASSPAPLCFGALAPVPTPVLAPTTSRRSVALGGLCWNGSLSRASWAAALMREAVQPPSTSSAAAAATPTSIQAFFMDASLKRMLHPAL